MNFTTKYILQRKSDSSFANFISSVNSSIILSPPFLQSQRGDAPLWKEGMALQR